MGSLMLWGRQDLLVQTPVKNAVAYLWFTRWQHRSAIPPITKLCWLLVCGLRVCCLDCLPIPKLLCFAWYSLDVFFTSSTICHLCMISIDRYMAFNFPLRYGHVTNKRLTIIKIAVVWIVSFCIAGPLFVLSMLDSRQSLHHYKGKKKTRSFA